MPNFAKWYPPFGKKPNYFRFFLVKASLIGTKDNFQYFNISKPQYLNISASADLIGDEHAGLLGEGCLLLLLPLLLVAGVVAEGGGLVLLHHVGPHGSFFAACDGCLRHEAVHHPQLHRCWVAGGEGPVKQSHGRRHRHALGLVRGPLAQVAAWDWTCRLHHVHDGEDVLPRGVLQLRGFSSFHFKSCT